MKKTVYITTSIPYVNGAPHIGHALEFVQADVLARVYRESGHDVYLLAGTDENAIKNVETAEKLNMSTQDLVDQLAEKFLNLREPLNFSYDQFIRTTSEKHKAGAKKLWELCEKDIYKKSYDGLYCVGCESFYKDGEFADNICPEHNRKLEIVSEVNYFFNLSNYKDKIAALIEGETIKIYPEFRRAELLSMLKGDLGDFSISRPTERTRNWGIEVPGDSSQRIYVWYDALANYITALDFATGGPLYKKYWENADRRIHVIGKSIIKFHAIYWIGMLLSAGLPLPDTIYAHGFINVEGTKMSKSLGNVVNPSDLVAKYGTDPVRYYLLKEIPALDDGSYSDRRFKEIYNADLANSLGNLVSRLAKLSEKNSVKLIAYTAGKVAKRLKENGYEEMLINYQFNLAIDMLWREITIINQRINKDEPWAKSGNEAKILLEDYTKDLADIAVMLAPFLPSTSENILTVLKGEQKISKPLFPRIV